MGKDGTFNFSFRFGKNRPWREIVGKFTLSVDGKSLFDENAKYQIPSRDPDRPRFQTVKVSMQRA
ncbi:MAG: hypothetical protein AAB774_00750 [Patescibacteria group bacterium]